MESKMTDDSYILGATQRENASLNNEIAYLRSSVARLLIQKDESRDIARRLANALMELFYYQRGEAIIPELLDEFTKFDRANKERE